MLSKKAKYALKALEYIAQQDRGRPVLIAEIAVSQRIPRKFLEVILLEMRKDGILRSKMGKNGGYFLHIPPEEIKLGHIIRLIDGPIALVPCVSYKFYSACSECRDEETCGLRHALAQVREATNKILNKVSLADILRKERRLKGLKTEKFKLN